MWIVFHDLCHKMVHRWSEGDFDLSPQIKELQLQKALYNPSNYRVSPVMSCGYFTFSELKSTPFSLFNHPAVMLNQHEPAKNVSTWEIEGPLAYAGKVNG